MLKNVAINWMFWLIVTMRLVDIPTTRSLGSQPLASVVMKFFRLKNVSSLNVFLCHKRDGVKLLEDLQDSKQTFVTNVKVFDESQKVNFVENFHLREHRLGVAVDLSCHGSRDMLQQASLAEHFNTSYVYAIISHLQVNEALEILEPLKIQFDSDVTLLVDQKMYDVHRTSTLERATYSECGYWNEEEHDFVYVRPARWNLNGTTVKATTVVKQFKLHVHGFQKFVDPQFHPEIDTLSRFALVAQKYLEFQNNFKTNLSIAPDWGYYNPVTGKVDENSMYGWLEQGTVDLGLSLSRMFSGRLNAAFWTPTIRTAKTCVLFRHPSAGVAYDGFARPFRTDTWLVTFAFVLVSSSVLNAMRRQPITDDPPNESEYNNSLLNVIAILSLQSSYIKTSRLPVRTLSVVLHIFGILVYSYYGAEIVGFLLNPSPRTLTTVEKLVESRMDLWTENISYHKNHFESKVGAKATLYYELAIKKKNKFIDRQKGIVMVQKGGVAMYGLNTELFKIIENTFSTSEICSVYVMEMLAVPTSIAVRKKSPYRELMYKGLSRFIESGLKDHEDAKWHTKQPPCLGTEDSVPVALEATLIAQIIFLLGLIFSFIFLAMERFCSVLYFKTKRWNTQDLPDNFEGHLRTHMFEI